MDLLEIIPTINYRVSQITIVLLFYISYLYYKVQHSRESLLIFLGALLITGGIILDMAGWSFINLMTGLPIKQINSYVIWQNVIIISQIMTIIGCPIVVYGIYINIKKHQKPL